MSHESIPVVESADPLPGRDAKGRFTTGNTGGPGNPFGRRLAAMRKAVMNAVSADDIEALLKKLLALALAGDLAAAELVLQYAVGKPKPVAEPDRTEIEAWEIEHESWVPADEFRDVLEGLPVRCASVSSETLSEVRCKNVAEMLRNPEPPQDEPLTEAEKKRMERDWAEANARFEADRAAGRYDDLLDMGPLAVPSIAGTNGRNGNGKHSKGSRNGHRGPSSAVANGQGAIPLSPRHSNTVRHSCCRRGRSGRF
jgi:hypothetical protein